MSEINAILLWYNVSQAHEKLVLPIAKTRYWNKQAKVDSGNLWQMLLVVVGQLREKKLVKLSVIIVRETDT